jgi:hypothetical protein
MWLKQTAGHDRQAIELCSLVWLDALCMPCNISHQLNAAAGQALIGMEYLHEVAAIRGCVVVPLFVPRPDLYACVCAGDQGELGTRHGAAGALAFVPARCTGGRPSGAGVCHTQSHHHHLMGGSRADDEHAFHSATAATVRALARVRAGAHGLWPLSG